MSIILDEINKSREYFEQRYTHDIETNRKGDFTVELIKNGKRVNKTVNYNLKKIDFEFGCNIFMLGQYDDSKHEEIYLKDWHNLFNTAVVPLYWEGTEPIQNFLRYNDEVPNDIYRRPPVDSVVKYCEKNNITMKGHPLFWHEFIPSWLPENWDELLPLIEKRFKEISERYSDKMPAFDCVNEPSRIWDMCFEHKSDGYKMIKAPDGYLEKLFELGRQYFGNNELIINEATSAAFTDVRGIYGGYYQLLQCLINKGLKIDRIGLQCHICDHKDYINIFNSERLYGVLDLYGRFNKPIVLSEIGLSEEDEELQAMAAERLYKVCFSHKNMQGIFWWNLDDNSILCTKNREAGSENLPFGGLTRNGRQKAAYKALDNLINHEWKTVGKTESLNGEASFRGFYGIYDITVDGKTYTVDLNKAGSHNVTIEL